MKTILLLLQTSVRAEIELNSMVVDSKKSAFEKCFKSACKFETKPRELQNELYVPKGFQNEKEIKIWKIYFYNYWFLSLGIEKRFNSAWKMHIRPNGLQNGRSMDQGQSEQVT